MIDSRGASVVSTCEQWGRAWHTNTAIEGSEGALTLAWQDKTVTQTETEPLPQARGLALDRLCRVYRLRRRSLGRLSAGSTADGLDYPSLPDEVQLMGESGDQAIGIPRADLLDGVGIAIDDDDRLFIADRGRRTIAVLDIWSKRLIRTVRVATPKHPNRYPTGLASARGSTWAVLRSPAGLIRLTATRGPLEVDLPQTARDLPRGAEPTRIAVSPDGELITLWHEPSGSAWLVGGTRPPEELRGASDIIIDAEGAVVVAPSAQLTGAVQLRRLVPTAMSWVLAEPVEAAGYDGGGLVLTDGGRIGFFTKSGFRLATIGLVKYATSGRCVSYRLDSGQPRNRWGRILVDACIPNGTAVRVGAITSDDESEGPSLAYEPPQLVDCEAIDRQKLEASPPLPSSLQVTEFNQPLHQRPFPTTPWWRYQESEPYDTYEAPVAAAPGRYIWVTIDLEGGGSATPRVREVRVERRAHNLMRRLPKVYSEEPQAEAFLHRYLSMLDSMVRDLDLRSTHRDLLVDPRSTPIEMLDWLASFVGLLLDDRWAEQARRRLIEEIVQLYRMRGTPWALSRCIQIYLAGEIALGDDRLWLLPVIIEHYRLRGLGGPLVGEDPTMASRSLVGAGFRVGGEVGDHDGDSVESDLLNGGSFGTTAHRFSVLIPRPLAAEEESAVRHLLDVERPAHTSYELCTVDAGMRVGRGLHLGLSTIVGPTGALAPSIVGAMTIGSDAILGHPSGAIAVGAARLESSSRIR